MKPESVLADIREQVVQSRLSHLPTNFCFLFNGHPLDPNVEANMKASDVAIPNERQRILLIDNVHCNIASTSAWLAVGASHDKFGAASFTIAPTIAFALIFLVGLALGYAYIRTPRASGGAVAGYEKVPLFATHDADDNSSHPKPMVPCLRPPCLHPRLLTGRIPKARGTKPKNEEADQSDVEAKKLTA